MLTFVSLEYYISVTVRILTVGKFFFLFGQIFIAFKGSSFATPILIILLKIKEQLAGGTGILYNLGKNLTSFTVFFRLAVLVTVYSRILVFCT